MVLSFCFLHVLYSSWIYTLRGQTGSNTTKSLHAWILDGRILPYETIFFYERRISGTDKADWGREASPEGTKEKVISAIDLKPKCWMVLFTQWDEPRANGFVQMMRQVTRKPWLLHRSRAPFFHDKFPSKCLRPSVLQGLCVKHHNRVFIRLPGTGQL